MFANGHRLPASDTGFHGSIGFWFSQRFSHKGRTDSARPWPLDSLPPYVETETKTGSVVLCIAVGTDRTPILTATAPDLVNAASHRAQRRAAAGSARSAS